MPENDHHLPLLQCASTVIIWIGFFYGNSFQYERHKFLKHYECDIFPECDVLL